MKERALPALIPVVRREADMNISMRFMAAISVAILFGAASGRAAGQPGASSSRAEMSASDPSTASKMPGASLNAGPCSGDKPPGPPKPGQQSATQLDPEAQEDPREPCDQTLDEEVE